MDLYQNTLIGGARHREVIMEQLTSPCVADHTFLVKRCEYFCFFKNKYYTNYSSTYNDKRFI